MKLLFINPNLLRQEYISFGIAYLASYLKEKGHTVDLMDYTWGGGTEDGVRKVMQIKPDMVCFSVLSPNLPFSIKLAREIKKVCNIPIVFGGPHPTVDPEATIGLKEVDMICIGEGELALSELLMKMEAGEDISATRNFWIKTDNGIIRNPVRPLVNDIDVFPFPDRDIFDINKHLSVRHGVVDLMAGRGCPYECTYCINHVLHRLYNTKKVRFRRVDNVLKEIEVLRTKYDIRFLNFIDDAFTASKKWVREFATQYKEKCHLPFSCISRPEALDQNMCRLLKEAGCVQIHVGVESGSQRIRREILNRKMSDDCIINAFRNARLAGLKTYAFNMIGVPFESAVDMKETIEINRIIRPDFLQVSTFQPYPGTKLYKMCKENQWIMRRDLPISHKFQTIMRYPYMTNGYINVVKMLFRFQVLWRYNKRKALLSLIYDLNYELYIKIKSRLPVTFQKTLYRINLWLLQK